MNLVRLFLTILFLPVFVILVRGVGSRSRALRGMVLLAGVSTTGIFINYPSLLDRGAAQLELNSGADLVLYLLVLVMLTFVGYVVGKFRRIEQRLNRLVHELAVSSATNRLNQPGEK